MPFNRFRGSNKSGLFINGIPYGLMEEYSGDVLIQLPALFFNKVGLQVYPDITWVPDGDAGVLNLSSSAFPSSERVSPLSLSLGAGWHERYNAGAVLNLNPGRFHINAKYNYRKEFRSRTFSKTTTTKQNTTVMNNNADARPDVHLAELRLGYDISENDQIGVSGLFYVMDYSRYGRINNQVFNLQGDRMKYVIRNRYNDQYQSAWSADTYWKHQFQQGSHLSALFHYNNFKYDEDNDYKNENPNNQQIIAEDNQFINHDKHNYFWKLNYVYPFGENYSFQAGYQAAKQLWQAALPPEAIFAASDDAAAGIVFYAQSQGLAVPEQLAVLGFDNSYVADLVYPGLTTVEQPFAQMGQLAIEALVMKTPLPDQVAYQIKERHSVGWR